MSRLLDIAAVVGNQLGAVGGDVRQRWGFPPRAMTCALAYTTGDRFLINT